MTVERDSAQQKTTRESETEVYTEQVLQKVGIAP